MVPQALGPCVCLAVEGVSPSPPLLWPAWDHPMSTDFAGIEHLSKTVVPVLIRRSSAGILLPDRDKRVALA